MADQIQKAQHHVKRNNTSSGYLNGFSLESVLSMIERDQESWTLKVIADGRVGHLYFQDGSLTDAQAPGCTGARAAVEILLWPDSVVRIKDASPRQRTIHTPLMTILLETNRIKDEHTGKIALERQKYDEAVALINAFQMQKGQKILARILKQNPKNHRGWLWYSRTMSTLKDTSTALNHAGRLAPENRDIAREKQRLETAMGRVKDATVKRCPFCWTPLSPGARTCFSCHLQLFITRLTLGQFPTPPDPLVMAQCVTRFSQVMQRQKNLHACYYLAMTHYNMNDQDKTLDLLNQAVTLSGGRSFFKTQLDLFCSFTASAHDAIKPQPLEDPVQPPQNIPANQKTILVVEDSTTTRMIITDTLKKHGYSTVEAHDGLEALSMLIESQPDMILLDIILPKMNGYEILSVVKNKDQYKHIPVIMLTGRDGILNKMKGKIAGAAAYLTKPFQPQILLSTIEKYI